MMKRGNVPQLLVGSGSVTQAWQFQPESYGALGNGIVCADVGTNGTTTITSPTVAAKGQPGQYIMIHGANGATSGPLITTIASITGSGAVLSAAAGATVANCPAVFGTDDTAAIQAAVTAAGNYGIANNYHAEVLFGPKIYILGTGPTKVGNGTTQPTFNAQITLPYPNPNGNTPKLLLKLTGAADMGYLQYWQSLVPNVAGTALVSMLNPTSGAANDATFGRQSVIGGPSGNAGFTGSFANVKVTIQGIGIWTAIWHNLICWDLVTISAVRAVQSGAIPFAPSGVNVSAVQPYLNNITAAGLTGGISIGWRFPSGANNLDIWADDIMAEGQEIGFMLFDHFAAGRMNSIYCDVVAKWDSGIGGLGGNQHGIFIQSMAAEAYNGGFRTNGGQAQVFINWDTEGTTPAYDINDGGNLYGYFYYGDRIDQRAPIVVGGANLTVVNQNLPPGHMTSPPAVPASGVAAALVYRTAYVSIHTGAGVTVSAITIDGTATGLTMPASSSLAVMVPNGKTIALTYAGGTPTWDWWADG